MHADSDAACPAVHADSDAAVDSSLLGALADALDATDAATAGAIGGNQFMCNYAAFSHASCNAHHFSKDRASGYIEFRSHRNQFRCNYDVFLMSVACEGKRVAHSQRRQF